MEKALISIPYVNLTNLQEGIILVKKLKYFYDEKDSSAGHSWEFNRGLEILSAPHREILIE